MPGGAVAFQQTLTDDPAYRQAREDVERLREHLRRDVERAEQRDHELARLRREAEELWSLRARVAELESTLAGAARPMHEAGQHDQVPLSRQQRRAALRAARKTYYPGTLRRAPALDVGYNTPVPRLRIPTNASPHLLSLLRRNEADRRSCLGNRFQQPVAARSVRQAWCTRAGDKRVIRRRNAARGNV